MENEQTQGSRGDQAQAKKTRTSKQNNIRPCDNCGRILPHQGKGLCGGCRRVTKTTPPEQLEAALAAAKIRFNAPNFDGKHPSGQRRKLPAIPAEAQVDRDEGDMFRKPVGIETCPPTEAVISVHSPNILLVFPSPDRPLYDAILAEAKRNRRDPDQQILWILQGEIKRAV
jgi:hypothetical protein